ncbi:MAG TPA: ATP-binding protein, partial [Stenomitos sp.]
MALINDILDVAKIEAGRLELEISTVSISHLCNSSLAFVRQQALQKQIQLQVSQLSHLTDIAVDERRMRQVLINLLTNAVKFTPVGGRVTLEVYLEPQIMNLAERVSLFRPKPIRSGNFDKYVHFSTLSSELRQSELCFAIRDTGIGIPESFRQKLFQPFVQVDSSLNRQYEGTGLGLTLVKQIAELHGGSVDLESEPGRGSCFTVRLPASCIESTELLNAKPYVSIAPSAVATGSFSTDINAVPEGVVELTHKSPLILLAEDSEANVGTISSYLNAKGFRLEWAKNGEEAIALTKTLHPDLILMDIQMPG